MKTLSLKPLRCPCVAQITTSRTAPKGAGREGRNKSSTLRSDMRYNKKKALADNVNAIETALAVHGQGRQATDSEKKTLAH